MTLLLSRETPRRLKTLSGCCLATEAIVLARPGIKISWFPVAGDPVAANIRFAAAAGAGEVELANPPVFGAELAGAANANPLLAGA